ncbi:hypothetical protein HNQ94_001916 [Salirhabdus euzebyi]|uniref:Thioredoxin n=1 Tax=Salirhabdus euzebyi TaxID=394506 RepID=A0A841Q523_9BACI|nr:thioredoxin family protein [Salirhabdus euzebyi]MBB6453467.1 hypothetical protein [Salirhabdus euzebyi]
MIELNRVEFPVVWNSPYYQFIFIHTPLCGTCKLAKKMLETMENIPNVPNIHAMNAFLFPDYMRQFEVKSVPCLAIVRKGALMESIYAFQSIPNVYEKIKQYL